MTTDYSKTYWSNAGKHEERQNKLEKLLPASGEVPNANLHSALEIYRVAANCYYDLYNNGLCNRAQEFRKVFGFSAVKLTQRNHRGLGYQLTQELIDRTETRMDEIILAAYAEQFHQSGPCVSCPHCGGSGKVPTAGKPLPNSV